MSIAQPSTKLEHALERFERCHREDPRLYHRRAETLPYSVWYHQRLRHWVEVLDEHASEPLRLAAACQHIRRWTVARDTFPAGPSGYKRWRSHLARVHAEIAEAILRDVGYDDDAVVRVRALLQKKGLKVDPEVQLFEDAICLVFLENELSSFADKHDDEKIVDILRKTWAKMSPRGHRRALELAAELSPRARGLVERAVAVEHG
jgi:hypothetical protein